MSKRLNLREYQQRVIDRMQDRELSGARISTLGMQIAGHNWLVEMTDISEVMPLPPLTPAPYAKPWFIGVANVRGNLYGVTDMAAYLYRKPIQSGAQNRMLLVAGQHHFNAALLVDRVLGLRDARTWQAQVIDGQPGYKDEHGDSWRQLDVPGLLAQTEFLQIGA